jgi:hypothetical protein
MLAQNTILVGATLTPAQRDGVACVVCGGEDGAMVPVGTVDGCQVFAHRGCVSDGEPVSESVILVVGDASTIVALEDLTAFASDVADRLQIPAEIAVGRDYDITQYDGVVVADNYLESIDSAVLAIEAFEADVFAITADLLYAYPIDERCGHCGEDGDAAPVLVGNVWTTSVCAPCVDGARQAAERTLVPVAH